MSENVIVMKKLRERKMTPDELAQRAYNAYGRVIGYKNFRGDPMPQFTDLPTVIQRAWFLAVAEVLEWAIDPHGVLTGGGS